MAIAFVLMLVLMIIIFAWADTKIEISKKEMMEKVGKTRVIATILPPTRNTHGETHVSYPDGEIEKFISSRVSFYETEENPKVVYQNRNGFLGADIYLTKEQLLLVVNAYLKNF